MFLSKITLKSKSLKTCCGDVYGRSIIVELVASNGHKERLVNREIDQVDGMETQRMSCESSQ